MKTVTLLGGILVAVIFSLLGSVAYFVLSAVLPHDFLIRLLISVLSFAYSVYLLSRSHERIGRVSVIALWIIQLCLLWVFSVSIVYFVSVQLASIWLIRSLYFYSSLILSFFDLALMGLSVCIAIWAASHTSSLFLTLWCFFLTQALFVFIPRNIKKSSSTGTNKDDFQHAYRSAEAAIRKLSTY